ncbi:MAG TPA: GNAT family N-acetyltransferase [Chthonomonadales bacterium]|nr:GNAT family N-acetyltransferase [Chthonomonadales bacterium]
MTTLHSIPLDEVDWGALDAYPDRTIFQTREWLAFIAETQRAEPVVAEVREGGALLGFFTGAVIRRFGLRLLGSPFPGWTTAYMGFNLVPGADRRSALAALVPFALRDLRCVHLEVMDRRLTRQDAAGLGYEYGRLPGYEIDLARSEGELFARMTGACRRCIRKAQREGVTIEQAHDDGFADDYHAQLVDVFAKQGLVPTYGVDRVRSLMRRLLPTGRLLLLRAREPGGRCIATGIFPAMNGTMYFWGGASWRPDQHWRPNEALQWHAMRHWREKGIARYDMGGGGDYKAKFGGERIGVPWFRRSRCRVLAFLRERARGAVRWRQRSSGARAPARVA